MNWLGRVEYGSRTYPDADNDEAIGSRLRLDFAVVTGWAKQQFEKMWNMVAPRSEDFLPLVLDRENDRRAAWAKREAASHAADIDRAS